VAPPRVLAERTEESPTLPGGEQERFSGYGVMGLPFRSGHVLGLRRFPASSIGPGYTSVWHRSAAGDWTIYQDVPAVESCPRYFGPRLRRALQRPVRLRWTSARSFLVEVDHGEEVRWEVSLAAPLSFRAMNAMARMVPGPLWHSDAVLHAMGILASRMLGAGRIALEGTAPSGQRFAANPRVAWAIPSSRARVEGVDLGEPGPLPEQERLGDFWIPQRGLFVIGNAFFEPLDPRRHRLDVHAEVARSV
jgi:hypothetical protein